MMTYRDYNAILQAQVDNDELTVSEAELADNLLFAGNRLKSFTESEEEVEDATKAKHIRLVISSIRKDIKDSQVYINRAIKKKEYKNALEEIERCKKSAQKLKEQIERMPDSSINSVKKIVLGTVLAVTASLGAGLIENYKDYKKYGGDFKGVSIIPPKSMINGGLTFEPPGNRHARRRTVASVVVGAGMIRHVKREKANLIKAVNKLIVQLTKLEQKVKKTMGKNE